MALASRSAAARNPIFKGGREVRGEGLRPAMASAMSAHDEVTAVIEQCCTPWSARRCYQHAAETSRPDQRPQPTDSKRWSTSTSSEHSTYPSAYDLLLRDHGAAGEHQRDPVPRHGPASARRSPKQASMRFSVPARSNGTRRVRVNVVAPGAMSALKESGESLATSNTAPSRIRCGARARPPRSRSGALPGQRARLRHRACGCRRRRLVDRSGVPDLPGYH